MKNTLIAILLLLVSPSIFAQSYQIHNKKITHMHVYKGNVSIKYTPAIVEDYCPGGGSGRFDTVIIAWAGDDNLKAAYSAALTAYTSGKVVGFGVNDCKSGNGGVIPSVYRLDMHDVGVPADEIVEE